jgi:hypothetical protein
MVVILKNEIVVELNIVQTRLMIVPLKIYVMTKSYTLV